MNLLGNLFPRDKRTEESYRQRSGAYTMYSNKTGGRLNNYPLTNHAILIDIDETMARSSEHDLDVLHDLGLLTNPEHMPLRDRLYQFTLEDIGTKKGSGTTTSIWGLKRPYSNEFLTFCFRYFRVVGIWSAGQEDYVNKMCEILFRDIEQPHLILHKGHCQKAHIIHKKKGGKEVKETIIDKPLEFLFSFRDPEVDQMGYHNTFCLDNLSTTFINNPDNGILIRDFNYEEDTGKPDIDKMYEDDRAFPDLMAWLMRPEVMYSKDVRLLDKRGIFSNIG